MQPQQHLKLKRGKLYRLKQRMLMRDIPHASAADYDEDTLAAGSVLFLVDVVPDRDKGDEYFVLTFILPDGEILRQCFLYTNLSVYLELCK